MTRSTTILQRILLLLSIQLLLACTQHHSLHRPEYREADNDVEAFYGAPDQEGVDLSHPPATWAALGNRCIEEHQWFGVKQYRVDKALETPIYTTAMQWPAASSQVFSPGDLLQIDIENGDGFSGKYVVSSNGFLKLPHIAAIKTAGINPDQLSEKIELALVRQGLFRPGFNMVSVNVLHWAEIEVTVRGAVFESGRVRINEKVPEQVIEQRLGAFGDYSSRRMLSEALRAAAGIRPDAKIDQVILIRNGWQIEVDMQGIFNGRPVNDVPLVAGDQVVVPSTGCFKKHLVRPTQITPKGFRVFMSNLTDSAFNNSSAAVGRFSSNLPYGSRLLHAAISANCVGGKQWTNAPRKIVLASRNPLTGETQVIERSVEDLLRHPSRDIMNPYLMPNDAVACYDSDVTNLRDIAGALTDIISPFK